MQVDIRQGDCRELLKTLDDNSVDSIVTDPPYELGFMGRHWDSSGVAFDVNVWKECLRVLKPGGHLLSFSGTRTYHRMAVAIEDAGFEIRDCIVWCYGSGFPKSHNIGKAIDKTITDDMTRNWEGWGTALKPANEPICVARKPLIGTVVENVLKYGTGGINIDGCRVGDEVLPIAVAGQAKIVTFEREVMITPERTGRWPANLIHDGSEAIIGMFPNNNPGCKPHKIEAAQSTVDATKEKGWGFNGQSKVAGFDDGDDLSASRYFMNCSYTDIDIPTINYFSKASTKDRNLGMPEGETNKHPTVKPSALMKYLVTLVTPYGGTSLDPFAGSGSTGVGAY